MELKRMPIWLSHAPAPGVKGFATLAGIEAVARGILVSVFPLAMYRALQDASLVSSVYFAVGFLSMIGGLLVPFLTRFIPRRWTYTSGAMMFFIGSLLAINGSAWSIMAALFLITLGTVTLFVCFNAYVLDYITKVNLSIAESTRMFYTGLGWTLGPIVGVSLMSWWTPAPFVVSALAALTLLAVFWYLRLGNGKQISKALGPPPNPLAILPRFLKQPRLISGWTFAVVRSCGWWVYVVYLPIFAIENGLGDRVGGIVLSITNSTLFLTPLMQKWIARNSVKHAIRVGFAMAGGLFCAATIFAFSPWVTVGSLMAATFFLILLDVSAGLPFLLAVKPSERTEMSAIYSSFRDVSGFVTPGVAWLVLSVTTVSGVFAATGAGLFGAWMLAGRLHPKLGKDRTKLPRRDSETE